MQHFGTEQLNSDEYHQYLNCKLHCYIITKLLVLAKNMKHVAEINL